MEEQWGAVGGRERESTDTDRMLDTNSEERK